MGSDSILRIMVSARNAGAAQQSLAFIKDCREQNADVEFRILVSPPADLIYERAGIETCVTPYSPGISYPEAMPEVRAMLEEFRPHFILVGMATPGGGIDEYLSLCAKADHVPSGVIQDCCGDIGSFDVDGQPDVIFVMDKSAAAWTRKKRGYHGEIVVTGSPKHERYRGLVKAWESGIRAPRARPLLTFFGQPFELPGILENTRSIADEMRNLDGSMDVMLRPHPEDRNKADLYLRIFDGLPSPATISRDSSVEDDLLSSDVVLTAFSTVGIDLNHLQAFSSKPLGVLIYATICDEIRRFMREVIGTDEVLGVAEGMGLQITDASNVTDAIVDALRTDAPRRKYHEAARNNLGRDPFGAAGRILEKIRIMSWPAWDSCIE